MSSDTKLAEDVYYEVYGIVTENGDYLQPEHGIDLFLPTHIVELLTTTALVSTTAGLFNEFGKRAAAIVKKVSFRKAKLLEVDHRELVQWLADTFKSDSIDREKLRATKVQLTSLLVDAGFAPYHATRISDEVVSVFLRTIGEE